MTPQATTLSSALDDESLLSIGRTALHRNEQGGSGSGSGGPAELVAAAREYFATVAPEELKLGAIPALLADYRRLARVGWVQALSDLGPEALCSTDLGLPGRFLHFTANDVRLRDVADVLEDYRVLLAAAKASPLGEAVPELDQQPNSTG